MSGLPLTLERIEEILSTTKQRGIYEDALQTLADSGEIAQNMSELPYFSGMDYGSVRNSFNLNIEKKTKENDWPKFQVAIDKVDPKDKTTWQVYVVNYDALVAAKSEALEAEVELSDNDAE